MKNKFNSSAIGKDFKSRGQGMTEYIIILGLIAIAAIAAFSFFGQTVRGQVAGMANEVGGEDGSKGIDIAKQAADKALTNAQKNMNMKTYTEGGNKGAGN
nr:pilus assembly protein [Acidovorax sp. 62]